MNIFDGVTPPAHIGVVDTEARNIFSYLRTEKVKIQQAFKIPFDSINIEVAWAEFDLIAYEIMFKEIGGSVDMLYDPAIRTRIITRIFQKWPLRYYLRMLTLYGAMETIDTDSGILHVFSKPYKDSKNTISIASPITSPT